MINSFIFLPEVATALAEKKPVVALESTVITHGLPFPKNVETAQAMEAAVRAGGAVPATIAIIGGNIHIGLSPEQLDYLAQRPRATVLKCSRRDLPIVLATKADGATTVAGTMILAHLAGIEVFATGGIGGVHRGHPFDVSADLTELGRTPVTVVCGGVKSILDLPATREVLETQGVTVVGYGVDEMPAFYNPYSGLMVDVRADGVEEIAGIIQARRQLKLQSATLVTVPVPAGNELDQATADQATAQATAEADKLGIHGKEATPWLLDRMAVITNGKSMSANIALLKNNGFVAGGIAKALVA